MQLQSIIKGSANVALISIFSLLLTACGGAEKSKLSPTYTGFWQMTQVCFQDPTAANPEKVCQAVTDKNNMMQVTSGGSVISLDSTNVCKATSSNAIDCDGQIFKLQIINTDKVKMIADAFDVELTRITESVFMARRAFVMQKLNAARGVLVSLYGKTLTLVNQIDKLESSNPASNYETNTPAEQISETYEYKDDKGVDVVEYNPKTLAFLDAKNVLVNNVLRTTHSFSMQDDFAYLGVDLQTDNGQLNHEYSTSLGSMEIKDGLVYFITVDEWEYTTDGVAEHGVQTTTKVYNLN